MAQDAHFPFLRSYCEPSGMRCSGSPIALRGMGLQWRDRSGF